MEKSNVYEDGGMKRKKFFKDNNTIAGGSTRIFPRGFRSMASPIPTTTTAAAASTFNASTSNASSFSKLFSFAQNLTPSILSNVWSSTTTTAASTEPKSAPNGGNSIGNSEFRFGDKIRNESASSKHILGLDAYLSNDEDNEEEEETDARNEIRQSSVRRLPIANSAASTSRFLPDDKAKKRTHQNSDAFVGTVKRPKLSVEPVESETRNRKLANKHISSRRRFWTSYDSLHTTPNIFSAKPLSIAETPATSRSSSRASFRPTEPTNLFSVPPRTASTSLYGGIASVSSRTSSAVSRSRPSSVASNPPTIRQATSDYGRTLGFNSETRRILKDLERAAGVPLSGTQRLVSSNRSTLDNSATGLAIERGSDKTTPVSFGALDEAQAAPRLATLGSSLFRPSNDHSRVSERGSQNGRPNKFKADSIVPTKNWIVSSAPVFRFAKPLPVVAENNEETGKDNLGSSIFRFGNSSSMAPVSPFVRAPSVTAASTEQIATSGQIGQFGFNFPSYHSQNHADGNFR